MMRIANIAALSLGVALIGGCDGSFGSDPGDKPVILAASTQEISVGGSLEFYGANFTGTADSYTKLHFAGDFIADSGNTYPVDYSVRPHWVDGNSLVWAQVGPFANPFAPSDPMGKFVGTVTAVTVDAEGGVVQSDPLPYDLSFGPSIVIRELRPLSSTCGKPVERILAGFYYRIAVEAVGFTPVNFTYTFIGESRYDRPRIYRQAATGQTDSFGDNQELYFADVPADQAFYLVNVAVSAVDAEGNQYANSLVFGVHNPIEYMDSGRYEIAQLMAPEPTSGCYAGGATGRTVTYTETTSQTMTRQVGTTWSNAWNETSTGQYSLSQSSANSTSITRNESATEGATLGWSAEVGASVEGSVPGFAKASVSAKVGANGSVSQSYTQGWTVGSNYTETDTESWAFSESRGYTLTEGGSDFWSVSSTNSVSTSFGGQILPGQFGVFYRQLVRIALPGAIIAYDLCGNPTVVASAYFYDYTWSQDLATGDTCDPLPVSNLPAAKCNMNPCE